MIYYPLSHAVRSTELPLAPGVTLSAEGQALVAVQVGSEVCVQPSAGVAGELFVGFSQANTSMATFLEGTTSKVETATLNGAGVVELGQPPVAGTLLVQDETGAVVTGGTVVNNVYTDTSNAGNTMTFTYMYAMTVLQARTMVGDVTPGGYAGYVTGSVGVWQQGFLYTNQFDSSVPWTATSVIKLGANGRLTTAGTGVALNHARVIAVPSGETPFLGVSFVTA